METAQSHSMYIPLLFLLQLLTVFPVVPVSQVFQLIKAHLEPTGSDKAAEERGMYFGKLFALLSLIKSGRVTDKVGSILLMY